MEAPEIDIWYGSEQSFGQLGSPQRWANVLGTVSNPEELKTLSYSLNDGPGAPLQVGPSRLRLRGSALLIANHADVTIGNLSAEPL